MNPKAPPLRVWLFAATLLLMAISALGFAILVLDIPLEFLA
jgi:hypothetical protein